MQYEQHPLSAAFPSMPGHEVDALAADIKANGQREPAVILDGKILDGWHRYRACQIAGVPLVFKAFPADGDPVAFVKSRNLHRRHLSDSQRAAAVVACSKWAPTGRPIEAPAEPARKKGEPGAPFSTNADLAREADVSKRTIQQAKVADGAGLGDAVREGKVSAKRAAEIVKADPKVGKKIASGKVTADEVIAKAKPLPKILPRPEPKKIPPPETPKAPPPAKAKGATACAACEDLRARIAELEAEADLHADEVEGLLAQIEGEPAAAKEIKRLKAQVRVVEQSRDAEMTKCSELVKEVKRLQRKIDRLEKASAK